MPVRAASPAWRNRITGHGEVAPNQLLANPRNWRVHPQHQQDALKGVLDQVGFVQSVIVNQRSGFVVDGHARIALAITKQQPTVPVVYVDLDEHEEGMVLATLDPISALAGSDADQLSALLEGLEPADEAVAKLLRELAPLRQKELNPDDADLTPPDEPITQPGDLWLLGDHRLLCGDSTNGEDVGRLFDGAEPPLLVTDPPYGVAYEPAWRNEAATKGLLAYALRRVGQVPNDDRADWRAAWELFPGDVIYSWHPAGATSLVHAAALQDSGFVLRMQIIWAKPHLPIGRGDYHVRHEPCWYAVRSGKAAQRTDDRTQSTLWEISLDRNVEGGHSTQKPVECMARPIRNHTFAEVYDPFLGSGTTVIAAEQLDRRCYAMEIEPAYCDVSVRRWERVSGRQAVKANA